MTNYAVSQINCTCSTVQPDPARYAIDAVMQCQECGQVWRVSSKRSSNRQGGGLVIHGVLMGGMMRSRDVAVWVKQGPNVSRLAAVAVAKAASEDAYVRDAAELRRAVAAGQVPEGTNVRAYRAHREAVAVARVHAVRRSPGSMAYAAGLALLVIVGVMRKGTRQTMMAERIERHVNESDVRERETERRKAWLSLSQRP